MSDIGGAGWGFDHDWRDKGTFFRCTYYECVACGAKFVHDYPRIPEIGKAMYLAGIAEHCPLREAAQKL